MKTRFIVAIASLLLCVSLVHATDGDAPVNIPDEKLHFMITLHLKKSPDATITVSDMEKLSRFYAPREGIKNITGLEFATNLYDLNLAGNRITDFSHLETVPDDELGAILSGEGKDISGHIRLIRLKHSLSDWWQDPTALPSFMKWLRDNTRIRADMKYKGGSLRLTEPEIQDAPLIFMTGHDKDITVGRGLAKDGPLLDGFSTEERAALRKYIIDRGGMLFFDDCGFNGLFAQQVALELGKVFPEYPLKDIPHNHEIYKLYYQLPLPPRGGDVFWSAPGAAQGAGGVYRAISSKFAYQKGITIGSRLAVVYNRKDYLCSMETAEVDSRARLRDRRSPDVHRFMTNLLVYAMKYGGNTDRTNYQSLSQ